jgi:hypothetical protein
MHLLRSASRVSVLGLALGLALLPMSLLAAGDDPIVGRWSGEATEQTGGETSKYTYTIQLDSPSHGTTNYPSYQCTGELSGSRTADNTYSYTEKIKSGDCTDGGHLELKLVNHNTISMVWSSREDDTASGTLTRQ